jgi:hypothetical protein
MPQACNAAYVWTASSRDAAVPALTGVARRLARALQNWERSEAIRRMVSDNIPNSRHHGAAKHGDALLAGLIRCHRCGRSSRSATPNQLRHFGV